MKQFDPSILKQLYIPPEDSNGEDNGQITIIGGSKLFHGAPVFSIKAASHIVDMVFFSSPEKSLHEVSVHIKASTPAFIWVPWDEVEKYIQKSDAILMGNGFMRYAKEGNEPHKKEYDDAGNETREVTKHLLTTFKDKKWVIDAGSLQVMDLEWIPENAILTPNSKEYEILFADNDPQEMAKKYNCIIVRKGKVAHIYSPTESIEISGGNAGMTKGGTGDVMAGVTVAILAKNDPFLSACVATYLVKKSGEKLMESEGYWYSAEDLANSISSTFISLTK